MRFRIITRRATEHEWLSTSLNSDSKRMEGYFIQQKGWLKWRTLRIKTRRDYAGYYKTQQEAEKDLALYMQEILDGKPRNDNVVATFNLDLTRG